MYQLQFRTQTDEWLPITQIGLDVQQSDFATEQEAIELRDSLVAQYHLTIEGLRILLIN